MKTRTLRLAALAVLGMITAGPLLAQTAPAPTQRYAITIGGGESAMTIYVDANMAPVTSGGRTARASGPMGPLEAVTIGTGEGAMTVYFEAGQMRMVQTALMSRPVPLGPRRAVTVGSGESAMTFYIEEVPMTPAHN